MSTPAPPPLAISTPRPVTPGSRIWSVSPRSVSSTRRSGQVRRTRLGESAGPQCPAHQFLEPDRPPPDQAGSGSRPPQIAPTILTLLGLNPNYLQAVQIEHTHPQPPLTQTI